MKKIIFSVIVLSIVTILTNSCKKEDTANSNEIVLEQLGTNNFKPSIYGIKGFNHIGAPIVHNDLNILYEYNETTNSFQKLGNTIPNAVGVAFAKVVQDGLGNYYYHSGYQGEIFILNKTTNDWDAVSIATGPKNQMLANSNGDILVYINNVPFGGVESYYKKMATSNSWVKVLDVVANNPNQFTDQMPQFFNNNGLVFFVASNASMSIDGEGIYNDFILNTNTGQVSKFYDKTDPDNFPAISPYAYTGFNSHSCSSDGTFYSLNLEQNGTHSTLYKISPSTIPAKFVKVTEYYHPPLESGSTHIIYGCKINESTGVMKFKSSCKFANYSHYNLGVTSTSSSELKVLQHDGVQSGLISNPNGIVYVLKGGYLYKWK